MAAEIEKLKKMQRYYDALKRISKYATVKQLERNSEKAYGIGFGECIEYAYENVIEEAKRAIKGHRRP